MAEMQFDDLPSFDDLPDQAPAEQAAAPEAPSLKFDDLPAFDDIPDGSAPVAETPLKTGLREAAHGVIPAAAGLVGMGAAGAAAGAVAGPVGAFIGGVAGMVAGSMVANVAQDQALALAGHDDSIQRKVNEEANPKSAFAGGLAPAVAGMSPFVAGGKQLLQRGAGAAMMGGFEAGQQYLDEGHVSPGKVAASAAVGAAFPSLNRAGERLSAAGARVGNRIPRRGAAEAPAEAPEVEVDAAASDLAADPQAPQGSARDYTKGRAAPEAEGDMLTQGNFDPATQAAAETASPAPAPSETDLIAASRVQRHALEQARAKQTSQQLGEEPPPPTLDPDRPAQAQRAIDTSKRAQTLTMPKKPSVEAGFPEAGEPLAVGANDAAKLPERTMPELKGETPINDSITDAQKVAGNYPKARTHDFGKPVRIETHAGDIRRSLATDPVQWESKSPYDYGYFSKTRGMDKDAIDFARPREGTPEHGDRHFIIDQKNAETGKFDEHKVFTYYKDPEAARAHYEASFSDGKGPDRFHAISEVTRPELVKFLAKHTSRAPSGPYSKEPVEIIPRAKKPVAERAVVKDLVEKLKAKGDTAAVERLQTATPEQLAAAIEGKRVRKYGVETGNSAGYPVEGVFTSDGKPVTANTKAKAAERSTAHKAVVDWFNKSAPKDLENESNGALLDRLKQAAPNIEGWKPTHKPREWMLAREAQRVLMKPTPGAIEKYRQAERLLRGDDASVENYRGGNRIEADIARSKRSGDDAVSRAENKLSEHNNVEDDLIAAIDAKREAERKPKFDIPHEEAEAMVEPTPVKSAADLKELPRKTVNAADSDLAKIDTDAITRKVDDAAARRKAQAAELAGKKSATANVPSEEIKTAPKKASIDLSDPKERARIMEEMNRAMGKKLAPEHLPPEHEAKLPRPVRDLFDHFIHDERGSLNVNQLKADWQRLMNSAAGYMPTMTRTKPKSFRAMELRTPHDEIIQGLSNTLHEINQADRSHFVSNIKDVAKMPKELHRAMEDIYHARDADSAHVALPGKQPGKTNVASLPADVRALYDQHLKPFFDRSEAASAAIRALAPERIGPHVDHHIAHIMAGDDAKYNMLKSHDDPTQPSYNGISMNASSAKARRYVALERVSDGKRFVIEPDDGKVTLWKNGKRQVIKDPSFEFEDGKTHKFGNVDYTMRNAMTKEITEHARMGPKGKDKINYYTNAGFSAAVAETQLGSMARHINELVRLQNTPEFKNLTTTNPHNAEGWKESNLPNFKGTYMHPELKAVFDDYAGHQQTTLRMLNSGITKLLFWMPTAHINNVGTHWLVGRGWDNFNPVQNFKMLRDLPKDIKSVVNQDAFQMELRRHGAGTIYGSVLARRPMEQFAKKLGMEIQQNPSKWGPIADKLGVPLKALGRGIYDNSSKVMWAVNDMMLTSRVRELMGKGHSMQDAIIEAERDIPNYRIPHKIIGHGEKGRSAAEFMGDPLKTSFGRYHYGMINSYANIVKDALSPKSTMGDRIDAAGKLMTMGVLGMVLYPLLDKGAKWVTGNDAATVARRGPLSLPHVGHEAMEAKTDPAALLRGVTTMPPLASAALSVWSNKDFRGKNVIEPGDVRNAFKGDPVKAGRILVQEGENIARGTISPYSTFANATQKRKPGDSALGAAGRAVRDAALDVKDPSANADKYNRMVPIKTNRDAITRFKHGGSGPAEGLLNKITGY